MASSLSGYQYDLFISYRQKDNKHDGWVSEFVNNLKGQLESTFKEEISVYFDINPHEGLLDTYDVNASLKEKLKCPGGHKDGQRKAYVRRYISFLAMFWRLLRDFDIYEDYMKELHQI